MGCIKLENDVQAAFSIGEKRPDGRLSVQVLKYDSRMGGGVEDGNVQVV